MEQKKLTFYEQMTLDRINQDLKVFCQSSLRQLAKLYNVSDASIVRLIKKLGFESLKSIQLDYFNKYKIKELTEFEQIEDDFNLEKIVHQVTSLETYSILETHQNINLTNLDDCSILIINSRKVLVFGIGNSAIAGNLFTNNLSKLGIFAYCSNSIHDNFSLLQQINSKDVLIIFSSSMKTLEVIETIKFANKQNTPVILITSQVEVTNVIYKYKITYHKHQKEIDSFPTISSTNAQILIGNMIFNIIYHKNINSKIKNDRANRLIEIWNKR